MSYAIANLLLTIIDLYWWVVIVSVALSWLVAFDVLNTRSQAAQTICVTTSTAMCADRAVSTPKGASRS